MLRNGGEEEQETVAGRRERETEGVRVAQTRAERRMDENRWDPCCFLSVELKSRLAVWDEKQGRTRSSFASMMKREKWKKKKKTAFSYSEIIHLIFAFCGGSVRPYSGSNVLKLCEGQTGWSLNWSVAWFFWNCSKWFSGKMGGRESERAEQKIQRVWREGAETWKRNFGASVEARRRGGPERRDRIVVYCSIWNSRVNQFLRDQLGGRIVISFRFCCHKLVLCFELNLCHKSSVFHQFGLDGFLSKIGFGG